MGVLESVGLDVFFRECKYLNPLRGVIAKGTLQQDVDHMKGYHGSRTGIMMTLIEGLRTLAPEIEIHFKTEVTGIDVKTGEVKVGDRTVQFDLIVGADGAGSIVQRCVVEQNEEVTVVKKERKAQGKSLYLTRDVKLEG